MEVTAAASGLDAKDLIEEANGEPFCSGFTRLLAWVAELEKAFQSVVIIEMALDAARGEPALRAPTVLSGAPPKAAAAPGRPAVRPCSAVGYFAALVVLRAARLAPVFSVTAPPVVSMPSADSRWARTNQWNCSSWWACPISMS